MSIYVNNNKVTIKIIMLIIAVLLSVNLSAQTGKVTSQVGAQNTDQKDSTKLIYFETDPIAYFMKGYSLHFGYQNWGWRLDLTSVYVDYPKLFEEGFGSDKFDLKVNLNGIKIDYVGNRTNWTKELFVGVDIHHQKLNVKYKNTGQS